MGALFVAREHQAGGVIVALGRLVQQKGGVAELAPADVVAAATKELARAMKPVAIVVLAELEALSGVERLGRGEVELLARVEQHPLVGDVAEEVLPHSYLAV